ncbi:MAG TPA: nuclear transport factor 2 family protein [Xanthobacteraceae bacterium]|nr:nuclear transport factor 2 family protein [Xanthobacteraceae bacterium]
MSVQPLRKEAGGNPRTVEEARAFVAYVESLFMPWNIEALVAGFTDDCVVRFGTVPEFTGRKALREFFTARSARQRNYRLDKQFRALMGDVIANVWRGEWEDAGTGAPMRGFGAETWVMRDGKIAVWEAAFNVARADATGGVAEMLR